ncbi:MAG: DUF2894 domain-containing protein [Variovorax sp.]|nr:DUF2894 domain-containing protein [Variovorax sp.]
MNTKPTGPNLPPPPLGEGRGGGGCSAIPPARSPHPNLPPKGEGASPEQRAKPSPPLATLNAHITQASQAAAGGLRSNGGKWPELRSAQRFRETWERLGAEAAVVQATHRAPENAGPLNSHMLVLRTLGLMRELSPHYLRRFLSHTETLLWLEQAQGQLKAPAGTGKAVKVARQKK